MLISLSFLRVVVAGWEILCIKSSICMVWYSCASLIGRGRFYCFKMQAQYYQKALELGS